ncbi:MAG: hypothetical protein WC917_04395 [Bacilli bacterium]|jgi:hypothetical protein
MENEGLKSDLPEKILNFVNEAKKNSLVEAIYCIVCKKEDNTIVMNTVTVINDSTYYRQISCLHNSFQFVEADNNYCIPKELNVERFELDRLITEYNGRHNNSKWYHSPIDYNSYFCVDNSADYPNQISNYKDIVLARTLMTGKILFDRFGNFTNLKNLFLSGYVFLPFEGTIDFETFKLENKNQLVKK